MQLSDIKYSYQILIIWTQLYDITNSNLIHIIYTQLYDFKYSYLIQIIYAISYDIKYSIKYTRFAHIWYQIFLSNTHDSYTVVWYQIFNQIRIICVRLDNIKYFMYYKYLVHSYMDKVIVWISKSHCFVCVISLENPVGTDCWIHRLHLYRGVRHPTSQKCLGNMRCIR